MTNDLDDDDDGSMISKELGFCIEFFGSCFLKGGREDKRASLDAEGQKGLAWFGFWFWFGFCLVGLGFGSFPDKFRHWYT